MLDEVQDDASHARHAQKVPLPQLREFTDVEHLDVPDETLPEAELLVFEVIDDELEELDLVEELAEVIHRLEAFALEAVED